MAKRETIEYLTKLFNNILLRNDRDNIDVIHYFLCSKILREWSFIESNYKLVDSIKHKNLGDFLAFVFDIESSKMQDILAKLDMYKNHCEVNNKNCLSVKL